MKLLILLFSLIVLGIFIWQNSQPIALVLFNQTLPLQLPLAVWLVIFLFLGILTSLILQFLYRFPRSRKRRPVELEPELDQSIPTKSPTNLSSIESDYSTSYQTRESLRSKMEAQTKELEVNTKKPDSDRESDIYDANFKVVESDSPSQAKPDDEEENWI